MFFNSNDYPKDQEYRARKMRAVENEQLARTANPAHPNDGQFTLSINRKLVIVAVLVVLFILSALALPQTTHAQSLAEAGNTEPFADAILPYRLGHYYFVQGDYERAVVAYSEAVEHMPAEVLAASTDYAIMVWDLGDAQLMAGQPQAALTSYQRYLQLVGDEASAEAAAYVQQLEAAIVNGTEAEVTLISG